VRAAGFEVVLPVIHEAAKDDDIFVGKDSSGDSKNQKSFAVAPINQAGSLSITLDMVALSRDSLVTILSVVGLTEARKSLTTA
jgi:hypothetical protein